MPTKQDLERANRVRVEDCKPQLTMAQAMNACMHWSPEEASLHTFLVRYHSVNTYRPSGRTLKRSEIER
jgi:hypothetical protein